MFDNIPVELRTLPNWIVWRLEYRSDANGHIDPERKPTKVPYQPWQGGKKAAANRPAEWGSFEQACSAPLTLVGPCSPLAPVEETGFSGIGFMFGDNDPYTGIDLDDTHGDTEAYQRQLKIFREFNSYSELSPSGTGLHIIVRGKLAYGRRRAFIEVYSRDRFFTMTGNVQNAVPVADRQQLLDLLFEQLGGAPTEYNIEEKPQSETDEAIIERAAAAVNGEKFTKLFTGNWHSDYPSQSEADMALVDIIAFYTQNKEQIRRIYRQSELGQAPKDNYEHRGDRAAYVEYMVKKSFDRQLPPLDLDAFSNLREQFNAQLEAQLAAKAAATPAHAAAASGGEVPGEGRTLTPASAGNTAQPTPSVMGQGQGNVNGFPPGLLGQLAQFILDAAPRPVPDIALAGAIALMSGVTGRAYNTYTGAGLNQYLLLLAPTGTGKDAISSGISKLFSAVASQVPASSDFRGPGELVSSAGLIKWMDKKPVVLSILGEIGLLMQQMASTNANAHLKGLQRTLLQLYSKSGKGNTFDPSAYSDKEKNTGFINAPSLTIIGESVPHNFYEYLDDSMISSGLLPRFAIFEYEGERPYLQEGKEFVQPPFALVQSLADLMAQALTISNNNATHIVPADAPSMVKFREFERWTTDQINNSNNEVVRHLWNRGHLKALKLASIYAIGMNPTNPIIDMDATMWATTMIVKQTEKLIYKFENDEVGEAGGSEGKQQREIIKCIASFMFSPHDRFAKYGGSVDMHKAGVVTYSHIQRRLVSMACFRLDRAGASNAIKRALQHLLDGDELREMPVVQMQASFGCRAKGYVMSNPSRFKDSLT